MSAGQPTRGLAGVVAGSTAISVVDEQSGCLAYRGYPAPELATSASFEEVAYLIWHGELPDHGQLSSFVEAERARRHVPPDLMDVLAHLPLTCHPMDILRTAVSFLGAQSVTTAGTAGDLEHAMDLWAKLPTIVAAEQRRRRGLEPIEPRADLSFAQNFFYMCSGSVPDEEVVRAFEASLVLYAEHGFNASTFAARVITSTGSDLYSAVTGAIGALKGPLHGGANEAVMEIFASLRKPEDAADWLSAKLAAGEKVMGFGHRVYKHGDSRVPTMRAQLEKLASRSAEGAAMMAVYRALEAAMLERKGLYPNLDYPSGPAYDLMGFDIPTFTPIFVMSRTTGWTAHIIEQKSDNALIRPLSQYVGPPLRPLAQPS